MVAAEEAEAAAAAAEAGGARAPSSTRSRRRSRSSRRRRRKPRPRRRPSQRQRAEAEPSAAATSPSRRRDVRRATARPTTSATESATFVPQADPPLCGQPTKDLALCREFVIPSCSGSWGRRPARWGYSGRTCVPNPCTDELFGPRPLAGRGRRVSTSCTGPSGPLESRRGPARPGLADRPGPPAEPRCRGIGSRGHDALPRRDRGGQRDPRRRGLLPREPQQDLPGCARTVCPGRARRRHHTRRRARAAWRARGRGRSEPRPRARRARARQRERGPLRADRPRDGDPARPDPRRRRGREARLGAPRRAGGPRRPRGADRVRALAEPRLDRVLAHRGAAQGELRADHGALRGGRGDHGRPVRASATSTGSPPGSSRATS